jgi:SAM-dependent methyltransferase
MSLFDALWSGIGRQLRCPSGRAGHVAGRLMTVLNREPNRLAIEALRIAPADRVLEIGFGPGSAAAAMAALASQGRVLGIDRSPEMLAQASRRNRRAMAEGRIELQLGDFHELPWQTETFDKILAVNVAYFFGKNADEIREARRVLRPGGLMAIYATDRETMQHWKFSGPDTHTLYGETDLRALILRGGFHPQEVTIKPIRLPLGIRALLALMRKNDREVHPAGHMQLAGADRD